MTQLLFEVQHGEGGDPAAEGGKVLAVAVRGGVRKARAKEAAKAVPQAAEVQDPEVHPRIQAMVERGDTATWHGLTACYWLVYPASVHAVSAGLAAKFCDAGKVIVLGTWADAEGVRVQLETKDGTL